ncbi:Ig-like domain-containing protein, partial [Flavobacterium suzhouense]
MLTGTNAGNLTVELRNSTDTQIQTVTVAVPAGNSTNPTKFTVNLGWNIPAGNGYRIVALAGAPAMVRENSGIPYPIAVSNVATINSAYLNGSTDPGYYFFYNWNYTAPCYSTRTPVVATVNTPAAFTLSTNAATTCPGQPTSAVTITSGAADYTAYSWAPSTGVSGNATTGWTFNPSTTTTYTLTASNSTTACSTIATVDVSINVIVAPTVPAATQDFCNAGTVADLVATGTAIKWYAAATGGTALASTTALVNGTTYYASQTIGSCESINRTARTANITVVAAPTIVNANQTFCNAGTVADLMPNDASIKWYAAATGGTALTSTTVLVNGTTYYASQTVGGCEGLSRGAVTVTLNVVAAPAISNAAQVFCNNATIADLLPNGAEIKWYNVATGGTALVSTDALVSGTTYYASQTVNGCEGLLRGTVTATVLVTPAPVVDNTAQVFCNTATVADLMPNDASIKWYAAATGGTPLLATEALVSGTPYFASQTIDGCEGLIRTEVTATINVTA